jgi:hypothetical protein
MDADGNRIMDQGALEHRLGHGSLGWSLPFSVFSVNSVVGYGIHAESSKPIMDDLTQH